MVLMDFRADHLSPAERRQPPTFLYAMDLGKGVYFVEETSLAYSPAISFEVLEKRLYQRLAHRGIDITEIRDVERCLFPMNLPLPDLQQSVMGFGGAASMVHPASGYLVGATLRRAPEVARAIAQTLNSPHASPAQTAQAAWQALWPPERLRKHYLYLFGLENLMQFDEQQTHNFFATFFNLPQSQWAGFLADSLTMPELIRAMLGLFAQAPHDVRWGLMQSIGSQGHWLWKMVQV
jgi:lycopene beta-cyclase